MKNITYTISIFLLSCSLMSLQANNNSNNSSSKDKPFSFNKVKPLYCYDGDTCTFNILDNNFPDYLNPMSIRFARINTKEMKSKNPNDKALAIKAKEFTNSFISNADAIYLQSCKKGKYFRLVCEVVDEHNTNLNNLLLESNLAEHY